MRMIVTFYVTNIYKKLFDEKHQIGQTKPILFGSSGLVGKNKLVGLVSKTSNRDYRFGKKNK